MQQCCFCRGLSNLEACRALEVCWKQIEIGWQGWMHLTVHTEAHACIHSVDRVSVQTPVIVFLAMSLCQWCSLIKTSFAIRSCCHFHMIMSALSFCLLQWRWFDGHVEGTQFPLDELIIFFPTNFHWFINAYYWLIMLLFIPAESYFSVFIVLYVLCAL